MSLSNKHTDITDLKQKVSDASEEALLQRTRPQAELCFVQLTVWKNFRSSFSNHF